MADKEVSFIGLGAMGFGMATHLVKQGYAVRGFDAYAPTLERFASAGGEPSSSLAACVAGRKTCIVMVATAAQAQAALLDGDAAALSLPRSATLLLCSTVPAAYVRSLESQLAERGRADILLVDCPVSGGAVRAADGTLSIMAGGSDAALAAADAVLKELSAPKKLYIVRGGIGAGSNMKMCHQVLAACQILGASEALGFAARIGLDAHAVVAEVTKSQGWSWMFENRAPRILDPQLPVASALAIIAKDTAIITSEARRVRFPVTLAAAAEQAYLDGIGRGWATDDDAGAARLYLQKSQESVTAVQGPKDKSEERVQIVVKLMRAINTLAAAEALALARKVSIDLKQLHALSVEAAGGSWVLREGAGLDMLALLTADDPPKRRGHTMFDLIDDLRQILDEAAAIKCPLYLASTVYAVATSVLRGEPAGNQSVSLLLRHYTDVPL